MFQTMNVPPVGFNATGVGGNTPCVPELPLVNCAAAGEAAPDVHTNTMAGSAHRIFLLMSTISVLLDCVSRLAAIVNVWGGH
jgi:hypothetical protein